MIYAVEFMAPGIILAGLILLVAVAVWWPRRRARQAEAEAREALMQDLMRVRDADKPELEPSENCKHDWRADPEGWNPSLGQNINEMASALFGGTPSTKEEVLRLACAKCGKTEFKFRRYSVATGWHKYEDDQR